jgi:hypothetical protein
MSGVSKVNKKSNLELLLLELFEQEGDSERAHVISVEPASELEPGQIVSADPDDLPEDEQQNLQAAAEIERDLEADINSIATNEEQVRRIAAQFADSDMEDAELIREIKNLDIDLDFLYEGSRGGISQQELLGSKVVSLLKKKFPKRVFQYESNVAGSTKPDVLIKNESGTPIAQFESKSSKGTDNEVSFFDQTLAIGNETESLYGNLLKLIAQANNLKFFKKMADGSFKKLNPEIIYKDVDKLAYAMINQASVKEGGGPSCGRYGELVAPPSDEFNYIPMDNVGYPGTYCSHEVVSFPDPELGGKDILFFKPSRQANTYELLNERVFFLKKEGDIEVYSYSSIKGEVKIKGKLYYWIETVGKRSAGDSGKLAAECFKIKRFDKLNKQQSAEIKQTAAAIINSHLIDGGDHYFAVVKPDDNIYVFQSGLGDPLKLNASQINGEALTSVGFGTYGTGGHKSIRMALKCSLNLNGALNIK